MTQAIIFDLDGTLVDSCGVCIGILEDMIADRGLDCAIDHNHARSFMSRGGEKMVAALLGDACRDPAADLIEFRARYADTATPITALFDGVTDGLGQLAALGFELAICSNKPQALCDKVLVDTGLAAMFRTVVGGHPDLRPKPAPDLLQATLAGLKRKPEQCVYVGDSELDHAVAVAAGMDFYFMTYGYADADWQPDKCYTFDHFRPLSDALAQRRISVAA